MSKLSFNDDFQYLVEVFMRDGMSAKEARESAAECIFLAEREDEPKKPSFDGHSPWSDDHFYIGC